MTLRNYFIALATVVTASALLPACGEDDTIGVSLLDDKVQIVVDSSFTLTGQSVPMGNIRPRTINDIIGSVAIPGFGSIRSNFVAQLYPSVALDTATFTAEDVDSIFFNLRYIPGNFIGDSIVPMGVTVYPLTKALPQGLTSGFNPEGYYNPSEILGSKIYTCSTLDNDSLAELTTRTVAVKLPVEFGRYLYSAFEQNPANYANGQIFAENVFPGVFVNNTFGNGRLLVASRTSMTFYLSTIKTGKDGVKDTIYEEQECYAVAPEVINNNNLSIDFAPELLDKIEQGKTLLIAPAGYEANIHFPATEIIAAFRNNNAQMSVFNSLSMFIPVDSVVSDSNVEIPAYVLLVKSNEREQFFAEDQLPNNTTSFYAVYDSSRGGYTFSAIGAYLESLLEKDEITEEDQTFTIVPVSVEFEADATSYYSTSYIVSSVTQYIEGAAAAELKLEDAKIKLTYSTRDNI